MRLLFVPLVIMLASAGCIQNMAGLKESVGATGDALNETGEALDRTGAALNDSVNTTNRTVQLRPPVARISIFEGNGALLYKATFTAEDPAEIVFVSAASKLSLIAGDSEAVERGATLTGFAWTLDGKPLEGGRQASVEIAEPGVYTVGLTVTDSNGKTDAQAVKLGLAPEPYEVVTELMAGTVAGAEGGTAADVAWELAMPEEPATVQSVTIVASPPITCDAILEILDADGASLASADGAGHQDLDQTETVELPGLDFAAYTIRVAPFACVATEVPITVTVVFLPIVEGLEAGDGHGHAH